MAHLPPKTELAFGRWPLDSSRSKLSFLAGEGIVHGLNTKLLGRGDIRFKDSYDILDSQGHTLEGDALRDAVLIRMYSGKDKDGELYSFISAKAFKKRKLRVKCRICPNPTVFDEMSKHKRHFQRHPTKTNNRLFAHPDTPAPTSYPPEWDTLSRPDWSMLRDYFKANIVPVLRDFIKNPSKVPRFLEAAEAKKTEFETWGEATHAGYFGPRGERIMLDWIHKELHKDMHDHASLLKPLTAGQFANYILMPLTAAGLMEFQQGVELDDALDIWARSKSYGETFRDEGDSEERDNGEGNEDMEVQPQQPQDNDSQDPSGSPTSGHAQTHASTSISPQNQRRSSAKRKAAS
ncbi:unnamed protein product [Tilletia controversa]|nr:hypothetical protein CF335_g7398 [Tilletia laevis]CAD6915969.1 unnamed protein product [Tilletia controversa]CAD6952430.1 unnamed protein product [Tilletia caries]CAD6955435.1 unnamed protein product [Tilletia controversa]CAD6975948.1 unnamed protein product [Tilletia controversa]